MTSNEIPKLRIGNLQADIPIIQGGMGVRISLSKLASAVANEGGIGVMSAAGIGIEESNALSDFSKANLTMLATEIRRARELTSGIIGVNIMVALDDYEKMVKVAYDEKIDIVFAGAGLPLKLPDTLSLEEITTSHTKFVPIVSSSKAAKLIFKSWHRRYNHVPDAIVVEGPLAGGHLGFNKEQINDPNYSLDNIFPKVLPIAKHYSELCGKEIPVIVAGGIYTGADIHKYIKQGVQGIQMGTRFVATDECDADLKFKEAYLKCTKDDITIIDSPVGFPGRAIKNEFITKIENGEKQEFLCPYRCLKSCNFKDAFYCIAIALFNAQAGNIEAGFAFAGANAFRVNKIVSVHELITSLLDEYKTACLQATEAVF